jgi:CheY-like chemotaxis protein
MTATDATPTVLVADDDPLVRITIAQQLRRAGFRVVEASDAFEALQLCETARPDVALVDYRMPGLSGIDLALALRVSFGIPSILLTGLLSEAIGSDLHAGRPIACLVKPVDPASIVRAIETALAAT